MARLLQFTYLANNTTLCSKAERELKNRPVDSRFVNLLGMFVLHTMNLDSEIWRHYRSLEKIYFGQL